MTKISIVTHRTGLRTDIVFHGPTDKAVDFYKAFNQAGEIALFVCTRADRTKKIKATEPEPEVRPPARKKLL
jgi:hypothetical protein